MIEYNKAELGRIAHENGFMRDTLEKVLRLKEILIFINSDDYLSQHLVLKGGTAINMTIFNLPRLSVDIDVDYIPNDTLEEMKMARETITARIKKYMQSAGYVLAPSSRYSFSLEALYFQYANAGGNKDVLKIEINYSLRAHIFKPVKREVLSNIFDKKLEIQTLAPMEIFAAKVNALMSRAAARDLYDFNNMEYYGLFDETEREVFRKCIIFYNSISQEHVNLSFDCSEIDSLTFKKIRRELFPVLKKKDNFDLDSRKDSAKKYINELMIITDKEREYMEQFEKKVYKPELLFDEAEVIERIKNHPMAIWKCRA